MRSAQPVRRVAAVALALLGAMALLAACGDDETAGREGIVSLEEVVERPSAFLGRTVEVSAAVDEDLGGRAFVLETPGPDGRRTEGMLVLVMPDAAAVAVEPGDAVQVTGEVQLPFRIADAERRYGVELEDDQLDDGRLARYRGEAYLVASAVEPAEEEGG